jgi:hypothetical protein
MATTTTFLSSGTFTLASQKSVTIECYGAGGRGSKTGNGGSGGAYSSKTITLNAGDYLVGIGKNDYNGYGNGGDTWFKSGSHDVIICQAGGGRQDGTIDWQLTQATGSVKYYGGYGSPDFQGYASYNGSGGGGGAGPTGNGANGQSAFFSTVATAAAGGAGNTTGKGGNGGWYCAGPSTNGAIAPSAGSFPGGGGGGAFDYGPVTETVGGDGVCYVTVP